MCRYEAKYGNQLNYTQYKQKHRYLTSFKSHLLKKKKKGQKKIAKNITWQGCFFMNILWHKETLSKISHYAYS